MEIIVNILDFLTLGASSSSATFSSFILIILMIALMYFFMIRPQQKQRKQHQEMMNDMHKGDEVVTIGRLHGKIDSINKEDRTVTLDCEGIYLTFDMVAIARVVKSSTAAPAEKKTASEDSAAEKPAEKPAEEEKADSKPADDSDAGEQAK
ncbi:preprotein translocase subunit YajC [Limosilactobacillus avium]|uniref:preprotein translocase subunit YajC n=1 Tax=Limosilactobacillus avium TaxID=2991831 RepID=UPI0024BB3660|nr:preprotein translocase subunit YajC [Limosilactobacillus avium]